MSTPHGAPEMAGSQDLKEETYNEGIRRTEAGANHYVVADRVTAPPGSCVDGAIYLIIATATGAFAGKENQLAIAVGTDASNGWLWRALGTKDEGVTAYVQDEDARYLYSGAAWGIDTTGGVTPDNDTALASDSAVNPPTVHAVRGYVDAKLAGLSWKQAVRAATTTNGTLATAFANGQTIDGVTLATGDRILVKNQTTPSENGIYIVSASGAPTRASDADSGAELVNASVYVSEGTSLADTQWTCSTNAPITVGTTGLAFAQLTSGGGGSSGFGAFVTLTDGATVTPNAASTKNFYWLIGGAARNLAFPTGLNDGDEFRIIIKQDATGGRTWVPNAKYKFSGGAPALSTGANAIDTLIGLYNASLDLAICSLGKGFV